MHYKKILVPTDFSEGSNQALAHAAGIAQQTGGELVLLHVIDDLKLMPYGDVPGMMQTTLPIMESWRKVAVEQLQLLATSHPALKGLKPQTKLQTGVPHRMIVKEAEVQGADLIVMSTHGRTGISHVVMGSVAEKVLRHAPCPILLVRVAA